MAGGNKSFRDDLKTGPVVGEGGGARPVGIASVLAGRQNALSSLGSRVTKVHELVDPARCLMWEGHNRDYAALNEVRCADLIESFKANQRQEMPAIVRRLRGDPDHDFEVICGARRHWSVSWMRAHDFPNFKFLVEVRELTDEEAFRVADIENRQREDISDYERSKDYLRAIDKYYEGSQQRMVDRLGVTKGWLSRYLEIAKLPEEVTSAFSSPHEIGIKYAAILAPILKNEVSKIFVLREAKIIADDQCRLNKAGEPAIKPLDVVRRLVKATEVKPKAASKGSVDVRSASGAVILMAKKVKGGGFNVTIIPQKGAGREEYMKGLENIVAQVQGRANGDD